MLALRKSLSIRSESSYELSSEAFTDRSNCMSIESIQNTEVKNISETIKELILQEKRRNFVASKTDVTSEFKPSNLKKFHSLSMMPTKKQSITLPIHLERLLHSNRKCPNLGRDDFLDSIYGAFYGFLIGDITGAHIAFRIDNLALYIPQSLLMNGGGTYNLGPGQGTEQTEMLFSTCYGLIEGGSGYDQSCMARHYLKWIESKPYNVSAIVLLAVNELKKHKLTDPWFEEKPAGQLLLESSRRNEFHESNVGLVRVLPLVVYSLNFTDAEFYQLIRDELSLICPNELVIETGIIYGMIFRTIFKTHDHQLAYFEAARWIYSRGSDKIKELWRIVELELLIHTQGNMGRLKTAFTYSCIEISKKEVKFMDSLLKTLLKGGDSDANTSIVMGLIGAIVGYNAIPSYFKQKIANSRMSQSSKPRPEEYTPYNVIEIVDTLLRARPNQYTKTHSQNSPQSRKQQFKPI